MEIRNKQVNGIIVWKMQVTKLDLLMIQMPQQYNIKL